MYLMFSGLGELELRSQEGLLESCHILFNSFPATKFRGASHPPKYKKKTSNFTCRNVNYSIETIDLTNAMTSEGKCNNQPFTKTELYSSIMYNV